MDIDVSSVLQIVATPGSRIKNVLRFSVNDRVDPTDPFVTYEVSSLYDGHYTTVQYSQRNGTLGLRGQEEVHTDPRNPRNQLQSAGGHSRARGHCGTSVQ